MGDYYTTTSKTRQARVLHSTDKCPFLITAKGVQKVDPAELRVWVCCSYCFT